MFLRGSMLRAATTTATKFRSVAAVNIPQVRHFSLDFEPLPDKYLNDPLDETAWSALAKSCYATINWKVTESSSVFDAITRMSANKIGALAVTKSDGEIVGIISERDYLCKVGALGRTSKDTTVGEICTYGRANLISVSIGNPIDKCMRKMLDANVRHLFVREKDTGLFVGMISIKDIVKCTLNKHDAVVDKLTGMVVEKQAMSKDS